MRNKIIPYRSFLKDIARKLRKESSPPEMLLWEYIRRRTLGVEFHRKVPIDNYIVDFYCHELQLVIEIDESVQDSENASEKNRHTRLEDLGITFILFSQTDIQERMSGVLSSLTALIDQLKSEPKHP